MKTLFLKEHGPFYRYLILYQSIGISTSSLINREMRPTFGDDEYISWGSKVDENIVQHINEIVKEFDERLDKDALSEFLGCMFINICYEKVKLFRDKSPLFEFFRHVRNAASHNNTFCFRPNEPELPAQYKGLEIISTLKGDKNPLQGKKCIGGFIGSADLLYIINDIEQIIPEEYFECEVCKKSQSINYYKAEIDDGL